MLKGQQASQHCYWGLTHVTYTSLCLARCVSAFSSLEPERCDRAGLLWQQLEELLTGRVREALWGGGDVRPERTDTRERRQPTPCIGSDGKWQEMKRRSQIQPESAVTVWGQLEQTIDKENLSWNTEWWIENSQVCSCSNTHLFWQAGAMKLKDDSSLFQLWLIFGHHFFQLW